ncbi:uncharacterized protein [Misgurnus anguillicaudatus]|uniref:uncharacterized protein isoform X4 n=1 Tax=Misgurnus anguillicaudatus TaxID=75329 RepID=UPI003CCF9481
MDNSLLLCRCYMCTDSSLNHFNMLPWVSRLSLIDPNVILTFTLLLILHQESLYLIVAFDEGASGPVAREWFTGKYDGGMAWWPPYKDSYKILQSILKKTSPNPSKGWKQYSCRVLHETNCFESLSKRWGMSCHTSDLNTDKEELPVVRQRRKPSRLRSPSPSPPSSPASCPSSDTQNAPQKLQSKRKKKKTHTTPCKKNPPPPPLLPMAGNNIKAVTNRERPSLAHPSSSQRSKPMSVGRKLANPPTPRLTPPTHSTSSYSEETSVNIEEEAPGLEDWRTEGIPDLITSVNEDILLTELTTVNWQQEAENEGLGFPELPQDDCQQNTHSDEGMCSPELSVNTNMPQCHETPLSRPGIPNRTPQMSVNTNMSQCRETPLSRPGFPNRTPQMSANTNMPQCRETPLSRPGFPNRTPQSQGFARSTPAGCTAVERLLLEQVGELQLKMDYIIKLLQKNTSVPHEDFNLNMLPLLTLQDLENFDDQLRADSTFKKKVITKLSLSGGKNLKETVWRVCTKIFDQNLSTQLNWCGRGQKTGLKSRPIHQVLLGAVLRNQPSSTEADIEMTIRNWLRLSRDRNGGRQRRGEQAS